LALYPDSFVTLLEIIAITARPIDVPNCATVLKTAPASAWVCAGKASVIIRLAIVKMTAFLLVSRPRGVTVMGCKAW
jgi:hypothetical protein